MRTLDRITQRADVMGGKACIRGLRVTVGMVVGQIAAGHRSPHSKHLLESCRGSRASAFLLAR